MRIRFFLLIGSLILALFFFIPLGLLFYHALGSSAGSHPLFRIALFTYTQALLSSLLAGILGTGLALLIGQNSFPGRRFIESLSLVAFSLPSLLVALGMIGFWGKSGLGFSLGSLFGWPAILAAHVFLNFPLFLKAISVGLANRGSEFEEAALSLGASRFRTFTRVTFPSLWPEFRSAFVLSFLFCASSFSIPLFLGGGPAFSTLEVAVYESIKVELNPAFAAKLASIQILVSFLFFFFLLKGKRSRDTVAYSKRAGVYRFRTRPWKMATLSLASIIFALLVGGPLYSLVKSGIAGVFSLDWETLLPSTFRTLEIASLSSALSVSISLFFAYGFTHVKKVQWLRFLPLYPLSLSPLLFMFCLSLFLSYVAPNSLSGVFPIVFVHAVCSLPLTFRSLQDGFSSISYELPQAAHSLGASAFRTFIRVELPLLRPSLVVATNLAFAFSVAETGAVLLFLRADEGTLPLWIFREMGRYHFDGAFGAGLILILILGIAAGIGSYFEKRWQTC